jgi:diguanylate cyclase (GGDEF)-like protein
MIAARLRTCARSADTVARLGGDEFAILVEDVDAEESGQTLIERIREHMAFPFALGGTEIHAGASVGSAMKTKRSRQRRICTRSERQPLF